MFALGGYSEGFYASTTSGKHIKGVGEICTKVSIWKKATPVSPFCLIMLFLVSIPSVVLIHSYLVCLVSLVQCFFFLMHMT